MTGRLTAELNPAWTSKPIKQDVVYEDKQAFQTSLQKLRRLPPLVTPREVRFASLFWTASPELTWPHE
jgi:3-deoxy-7-phosphoheptulonate synthase